MLGKDFMTEKRQNLMDEDTDFNSWNRNEELNFHCIVEKALATFWKSLHTHEEVSDIDG